MVLLVVLRSSRARRHLREVLVLESLHVKLCPRRRHSVERTVRDRLVGRVDTQLVLALTPAEQNAPALAARLAHAELTRPCR
eukprot:7391699-Prymnesium_polylepis.2